VGWGQEQYYRVDYTATATDETAGSKYLYYTFSSPRRVKIRWLLGVNTSNGWKTRISVGFKTHEDVFKLDEQVMYVLYKGGYVVDDCQALYVAFFGFAENDVLRARMLWQEWVP